MIKKKLKRLAIIPAKGKSSRIKNKNMKFFFGKRIIDYSIIATQKSNLFDEIHVYTEDKKIKNYCTKFGVKVPFLRKKTLANKNTPLFEVYKHTIESYKKINKIFDEIWCILPCSPLICSSDLIKLSKLINNKKIKLPCITVSKYPAPIEWSYKFSSNKKLSPVFKKKNIISSQSFKQKYYDVGVLSVFKSKDIFNNTAISINNKFYGFEVPWNKSVDIDNLDDWEEAKKKFLIINKR